MFGGHLCVFSNSAKKHIFQFISVTITKLYHLFSGMMHYASFFVTARMYAFGLHTMSFLMFQTASLSIFSNALVLKLGVHLQNL